MDGAISPLKSHWDSRYASNDVPSLSWYEDTPESSLQLIREAVASQLRGDAAGLTGPGRLSIIDIGAGASRLVDCLLEEFDQAAVSVLDISSEVLGTVSRRLAGSERVKYICSDVNDCSQFEPGEFAVWHDRAVFHFLTQQDQQRQYAQVAARAIADGGVLVLFAFDEDGGPEMCSGLPVHRWSTDMLGILFGEFGFELVQAGGHIHTTPAGMEQRFVYVTLRKTAPAS